MSYHRTISDAVRIFIIPEIDRRLKSGKIKQNRLPIEIDQFRVLQPAKQLINIIELNNEVKLIYEAKLKRRKEINELITLEDIYPETCYFLTPEIYEGEEATFWYYKSLYFDFFLAFDCTPNIPERYKNAQTTSKITFPLINFINHKRYMEVIKPIEKLRTLSDNNWPPAPAYYPDILLNIHNNPEIINNENFVDLVFKYYNNEYLETRLNDWKKLGLFTNRISYIRRSIEAHFKNDFISSIYIIVPQFEGIIKNYITECNHKAPNGFSGCVKILKNIVFSRKLLLFPKEIFEIIFSYLDSGSFWKSSKTISDPTEMVNRHGIVHGFFTGFECKAISLKYLILMDALSFILLHDKIMTGSLQ